MSDWLERELAHRLVPAKAPEGLWARVERGLPGGEMGGARLTGGRSRLTSGWVPVPAAAMASLALAAAALWLPQAAGPLDLRQLASAESKPLTALEFRTNDPRQIRGWLRDRTGLDVPIRPSAAVRVEGARVERRGAQRVAAVEYRVGQDRVTLLVARADPRSPLPPHGARASAWQSRVQAYALAGAGADRLGAACQLCHSTL